MSILVSVLKKKTHSGRPAYDKIISYIKKAKDAGDEILIGGSGMLVAIAFSLADVNSGDDSKGYFIQPTVILTQNAKSITLVDEIFGPVVTVRNQEKIEFLS